MGLFDSIFGGGTDTTALRQGAAKAKGKLKKGKRGAIKALNKAQDQYTPEYRQAAAGFEPFTQNGTQLSNLYTDALGGNGQAGYDNAISAFHTAPGYQFLQQQGEQSALRNNAALGGVASGNTLTDLAKFNTGLADQSYQQWMDNLYRGSGQGLQGAAGQASALMGLGNQFADTGAQKANVRTGAAGALATNASNLGLGLQNQEAADQASQLSLIGSILGAGANIYGAKKVV
jgi:hypothetical protein